VLPQVVVLDLEPPVPGGLLGAEHLRIGLLSKPQEEGRVLPPHGFCFTALCQTLQSEFANRLQHQQARLPIGLCLLLEQALIH